MTNPSSSERVVLILTLLVLLAVPDASKAQAAQPDGAGVRPGVLPNSWLLGGPKCVEIPQFQIHEYNEGLYILRESGCSNYEKPFLYMLFGADKALLLDTGAGKTEVSRYVKAVIENWLRRNKRESIPLVVAHTHAHRDHTSGDQQLEGFPGTTLVKPDVKAVQEFFGISSWPDQIVQYDLGARVLDVIPTPGHEKSSIAVYDRQTGILFTGDTLYPGGFMSTTHRRSSAASSGWLSSHEARLWRTSWAPISRIHARHTWIIASEPSSNPKSMRSN